MTASLKVESERLARAWGRHDGAHLRDYLVAGAEDPRLNVQSVLTRHFLLAALFAAKFERLMEEELRFAAALNWLHQRASELDTPEARLALLQALRRGADNAEGMEVAPFMTRTFAGLPSEIDGVSVPNYLELSLADDTPWPTPAAIPQAALGTFQELWATVLACESPQALPVLEPACGSANDYRFLASFGMARLLDYTGLDLCEKNVANARALFPGARFEVGNVFEIPAADGAFALSFVHDLFEHLSPGALPVAVRELCRVTRCGLCAGFFQMDEIPEHVVQPVAEYHWNTLSLARTEALFAEQGFAVDPLHIGTYLRWRVGCPETHNPDAYTFLAFRT